MSSASRPSVAHEWVTPLPKARQGSLMAMAPALCRSNKRNIKFANKKTFTLYSRADVHLQHFALPAVFCLSLARSPFALSALCPQGTKSIGGMRAQDVGLGCARGGIDYDIGFFRALLLLFHFLLAGFYEALPSVK